MNENKLQKLYNKVVKLVKTDPNPYNETNLWDWLAEGGTDDMTPKQIAKEWDEVNSQES